MKSRNLFAALVNVSAGRQADVVERIGASATKWRAGAQTEPTENEGHGTIAEKVLLLHTFRDEYYNRTVYTLVGEADPLLTGVLNLCDTAMRLIDIRQHSGVHPRGGVVDLVPIHPLGKESSLTSAAAVAKQIGFGLQAMGGSVLFYGEADPQRRRLADLRRERQWFQGSAAHLSRRGNPPSVSETSGRAGWTAVGATGYVLNCNVEIDTEDLHCGRRIASAVRQANKVEAMAFPRRRGLEIACNLLAPTEVTPAHVVARVRRAAEAEQCACLETVVVGYTEDVLLEKATAALYPPSSIEQK